MDSKPSILYDRCHFQHLELDTKSHHTFVEPKTLIFSIITQLEDVAQPSGWISQVVETEMAWHVVAVEPFAKIGESDGVLDKDSVVL